MSASFTLKALVVLLGLVAFPLHAFGMSFGLGIRESAMANAGLAMWASAGALAHNPAAAANLSPDRVVAGQTSFVQFKSKVNEGAQIESSDIQSMAPYIGSFYKYGGWNFGVGITSIRLNLSGSVPANLATNQPGFSFDNFVGGLSTDLTLDQANSHSQLLPKFASYRPNHLISFGLERSSHSDIFGISVSYSNDQKPGGEYQRLYGLNLFTSYDFNDE